MKKKILSLILALAMVLPLSPVAGIPSYAAATPSATVTATKSQVSQGDTITFQISLDQTVSVQTFAVSFSSETPTDYTNIFEYVSGGWTSSVEKEADILASVDKVNLTAVTASRYATSFSGTIFEITLKVKDSVPVPMGNMNILPTVKIDAESISVNGTNIFIACKSHIYSDSCDASCDVCGAERTASHIYDNACDASCNSCGTTRVAPHDYSVQDKDSTSHWLKCSVCGTIKQSTRDSHSYDNACDNACDECGYLRSVSHNFSMQGKNDSTHWMQCSLCGTVDENTRRLHSYDNACDTTCNSCSYTRTITHTYDNDCDGECNVCRETRSIEHYTTILNTNTPHTTKNSTTYPFSLSSGWYQSTNKDNSSSSTYTITAAHNCNLVLSYKVSSESKYDKLIIKKNSSQLDSISGEVSEKALTISLVKGDQVTITYSKDSSQHKGSDCGWFKFTCNCPSEVSVPSADLEPTCTEAVVCSICGTEVKSILNHNYSIVEKNDIRHWMKCAFCGTIDETTREDHSYDNNCDTTCNECEYIRPTTHDYTVQDKSVTHHWMKCSVCGAIDETTRKIHGYDNACDASCDACGNERSVPDHVYDNDCDADCNVCSHTRAITHDYSSVDKNDIQHWMKCSVCGTIDENSYSEHIYDDTKDLICNLCENERSFIQSIKIDDVSIIEETGGYFSGDSYYYSPSLNWSVTFIDGTTQEIKGPTAVQANGQWYYLSVDMSAQYSSPWVVGNTYTVTGVLDGVSDTFNVSIVKAPIKTLEFSDIILYQGMDSWFNGSYESYGYAANYVITFEDGTVIEGSGGFYYNGNYCVCNDNSYSLQQQTPWTPGNTYTVTGTIMGVSNTFNVTIKENPITAIQFVKQPDKTDYLVGEYLDINGATLRIYYNDNSFEDFSFDMLSSGNANLLNGIFSEKYQKNFTLILPDTPFSASGYRTAQIEVNQKTCNLIVTVRENLATGITIKEESDKTITITVYNSDFTSYDMKLLDFDGYFDDEVLSSTGTLFTNKGLFDGQICIENNTFSISLLLPGTNEPIQSNTLMGCDWFDAWRALENINYPLSLYEPQFNQVLTKENIDSVIATAFVSWYYSQYPDLGNVPYENNCYGLERELVISFVSKFFDLKQIDFSLSENYDTERDLYWLEYGYWRGAARYYPRNLVYNDGVWTAEIKYIDENSDKIDSRAVKTLYVTLNSDYKIIKTTSKNFVPGDVDGVEGVDLNDAIYLLYHVNFPDTYSVDQPCDFDSSGKVDLNDAIYLLYHVNFPETYPLH